jgi:uncharacterized YigZ family protein
MSKETDFFYTIQQTAQAEFKDRGSRFIAYAIPIKNVQEFKEQLAYLKKEHSKAAHHCFAYRIGTNTTLFRANDDGEPSGSAGRPILGQIDSKQLTNILVVVVRYFGGSLLGVPGLINAYKMATTLALQTVPVIQQPIENFFEIQYDYTRMNEVMMVVKQFSCSIIKQESNLFCLITIGIAKAKQEDVLYKLNEIFGISIKPITA